MKKAINIEDKYSYLPSEPKEIWVTDICEEAAIVFHERVFEEFENNPYKPIVIYINSYGGEVDALFSMLDSMDSIRAMASKDFKFITVAKGKACSAGAVLLSYGDFRFATPNTRLMLHQVISGSWGSQPANEVEFEETSRLNHRLLQVLRKKCKLKLSLTEFKEKLSHNLYLSPEQAQEFGLIDIIGFPKIIEQTIYEIVVINGELPKKVKKNANRRSN